jgi:hypothetical protein
MKISVFWVVALYRPDVGGSVTSETGANIDQTTQRKNPEDRNLHTLTTEAV